MCGVGAILFCAGGPDEARARSARMRDALAHRGPDGAGTYAEERAVLVHTRLALVDAARGAQPMRDPSGRFVLSYNGELYNDAELRAELAPRYPFRTASDAETLLAAYAIWGEACLERLDGMFAFVIWDRAAGTAFAARDPLGVKPLVYCRRAGGEVLIASETRALSAALQDRPAVHRRAVCEYLVVPSLSGVRRSMLEGVEHLGAGEKLHADASGLRRSRWAAFRIAADDDERRFGGEREAALALRRALESSVPRTLRADVPVGVFLSGGVDSTALAALAARESAPLRAFTIRFEDPEGIAYPPASIVTSDDAPFVEEVARELPLELERVVVPRGDLADDLARVAAANDRVPAWEQEISQHRLARAASGRRKAVLVGDAADETHFGYFFLLRPEVHHGPRGLMDRFGAGARAACLSRDLREAERPLATLEAEYRALAEEAGYGYGTPSERIRAMTHLVVTLWLGRLLHNGDVHTMAHGVEARVPFAAREVLAAAERVPPSLGFAGGVEKRVLREAARPFLPDSIYRRKKSALPRDPRGAGVYRRELAWLLEDQAAFARDVLDRSAIDRLLARESADEAERMLLFNLVMLLAWHRHHVAAP